MSDSRLLILDGPEHGLVVISEIGTVLRSLGSLGLTVALFEQNAKLTCRVADRIYILASGTVRHHDRAPNLLKNPEMLDHLV